MFAPVAGSMKTSNVLCVGRLTRSFNELFPFLCGLRGKCLERILSVLHKLRPAFGTPLCHEAIRFEPFERNTMSHSPSFYHGLGCTLKQCSKKPLVFAV